MNPGLYEQLFTRRLLQQLGTLEPAWQAERRGVDPAESPEVLTRHLAEVILRTLESLKPEQRVEVANRVIATLREQVTCGAVDSGGAVGEQLEQLDSVSALLACETPPAYGLDMQERRLQAVLRFSLWSGEEATRPIATHYLSHEGERPMAITGQLLHPFPAQFYPGLGLAA